MKLKDPTRIELDWVDALAYTGGAWCDEAEFKKMKKEWEGAVVKEAGWLVAKNENFYWVCRGWMKTTGGYAYSGLMMVPRGWVSDV